ncbi:MAG TPA: hypothetical protein VH682_28485 [Gemmataceae bacterium]|jgi:hypothetical protein
MKRTAVISSCLAVLCLTALVVWVYLKHNGQSNTPTPEGNLSNEQTNHQSVASTEQRATAQRVFELPMQVAYLGDDESSPCYVDRDNKILYRWKGVILHREQMLQTPYAGVPSRIRVLQAKDFSVVPIEAPVKYWYWKEGEGYRPGYLDRAIWTFYAWKGIVLNEEELLDKGQDGQDAIVKPAFPSQTIGVLEIDMPAHLKEHPELWKKGGAYTPEVSIRAEKRAAAKKAAERKAAEERARDPRVFSLLVRVIAFGENDFRPCYYDPKNQSLYPWKGVILQLKQLPNAYKEHQIVTLITTGLSVVPVEAPVNYREVNGGYWPGYLDRSLGVFYECKSAVLSKQELLDKSKDGQDAVVKPDAFNQVIEIDMPAHLKEHPELWKKT